jgi:hypothetical protein
MMQKTRNHFLAKLVITVLSIIALVLAAAVSVAYSQKQTVRTSAQVAPAQQPLYSEYRGIRIGMKAQEVRARLGEPFQKADDMDFYAFSEKEMAQIAYDRSHSVITVSVDYFGGAGAPDYRSVVGPDVEPKPDGSIYKAVRYEALGLWVYYNRTAAPVPIVTITLQKSLDMR